jgi:hypothetical protein
VRGRQIFGDGGVISKDKTYPVWRAGANAATAFHTDADLDIKGLAVPKGDYTLFVLTKPEPWQLIINKQTSQWGLSYDQAQDLGRVPMDISKPPALIETLKYTLTSTGASSGKLQFEWDACASASARRFSSRPVRPPRFPSTCSLRDRDGRLVNDPRSRDPTLTVDKRNPTEVSRPTPPGARMNRTGKPVRIPA